MSNSKSKLKNNHVCFVDIEDKYSSSIITNKNTNTAYIESTLNESTFNKLKKKDECDIAKTFRYKNKTFSFCFDSCICSCVKLTN